MPVIRYTNRHTGVTTEMPVATGVDVLGQVLHAGAAIGYLCMAGSCGTCAIAVTAGNEHLTPMNRAERFHCKVPGRRLACQAVTTAAGDVSCEQ